MHVAVSYDRRPSHPYYAGKEHVGFSPTRQTLSVPSAKRREVFGESHEGVNCILPRTARKTDFGMYVPTFLLVDDSANELYFVFWCGHSSISNGCYCAIASWVPYHIHTT